MDDVRIVRLNPEDWKKYREIRLEALKNDPDSFCDIYAEEAKRSDFAWKKRLENNADKNTGVILFLQAKGTIIGMGGVYYENASPTIANIWGIYIRRGHRRKGYGTQLINVLLEKIRENNNVRLVKLCVNASKLPALRLYEKTGFGITDKKDRALKNKYNEYFMEKLIGRHDKSTHK